MLSGSAVWRRLIAGQNTYVSGLLEENACCVLGAVRVDGVEALLECGEDDVLND